MSDSPTRVYRKDLMTVCWYADRCVHCENCVTRLPDVFNVKARPWINLEGADINEIVKVCGECPSRALVAGIT